MGCCKDQQLCSCWQGPVSFEFLFDGLKWTCSSCIPSTHLGVTLFPSFLDPDPSLMMRFAHSELLSLMLDSLLRSFSGCTPSSTDHWLGKLFLSHLEGFGSRSQDGICHLRIWYTFVSQSPGHFELDAFCQSLHLWAFRSELFGLRCCLPSSDALWCKSLEYPLKRTSYHIPDK